MARITEVAPADEAKVVDLICTEIDNARERITTQASWERLEEFFYQQLVHERDDMRVSRSLVIVAWAEAGHPAAHRAIRRYGREMKERSRFDEMLVSLLYVPSISTHESGPTIGSGYGDPKGSPTSGLGAIMKLCVPDRCAARTP